MNAVSLTTRNRVGVSRTTVWRWQKEGWLKLLRLNGRLYVPESTLLEFERRLLLVESNHCKSASEQDSFEI